MEYFVAVTDNSWFRFLAARQPDEVNFWRPSGAHSFRAVPVGAPFLFKLHSPYNHIAGGGFFIRYDVLPVSLAWEAFGEKNGREDRAALREVICRYRGEYSTDPQIGCVVLAEPVFFRQDDWIPVPEDWGRSIVVGKTYSTKDRIGYALWEEVKTRLIAYSSSMEDFLKHQSAAETAIRFGQAYLTRARLGQGAFRVMVTSAYAHRCAITGERTLPVLQAAHIRPVPADGPHDVTNGLLLRSDLHILFDKGYVTVTPDLEVKVSKAIREEYENGRDYYAFDRKRLVIVPDSAVERPATRFLEWHNSEVFVA